MLNPWSYVKAKLMTLPESRIWFPDLFADQPSWSVWLSVHLLNYLKHSHNFHKHVFLIHLIHFFLWQTYLKFRNRLPSCPDPGTPNADTGTRIRIQTDSDTGTWRYIDSWTWVGVGELGQAFLSWKPHIYAKAKWTWCLCRAFICSPRISCEFFNCSLNGLQWMQGAVATPGCQLQVALPRRQFIFWLLQLRSIGPLEALEGLSSPSDVAFFSELEFLITAEVLLFPYLSESALTPPENSTECVCLYSKEIKSSARAGKLFRFCFPFWTWLLLLIPGLMWRIKSASNWQWPGILAKIDEATLSRKSCCPRLLLQFLLHWEHVLCSTANAAFPSSNRQPIAMANANVLATCRARPQFVNLLNVNTALSQINLSHDNVPRSPSNPAWQAWPSAHHPPDWQTPRRLPGTQQTVKINKASLLCLDFFLVSGFRQQWYTAKNLIDLQECFKVENPQISKRKPYEHTYNLNQIWNVALLGQYNDILHTFPFLPV